MELPLLLVRCAMLRENIGGEGLTKALVLMLVLLCPALMDAAVIFSQPSDPASIIYTSARASPDGSDGDSYAYDSFQIGCNLGIAEIDWRGGYAESLPYAGQNPVYDFAIGIYAS